LHLQVAVDGAAALQPLGGFNVVDQRPQALLRTRPVALLAGEVIGAVDRRPADGRRVDLFVTGRTFLWSINDFSLIMFHAGAVTCHVAFILIVT